MSTWIFVKRDCKNYTPLHIACMNNNAVAVCALIDAGADVNIGDRDRYTPLHVACRHGADACIPLLIEAGADISHYVINKADNDYLMHSGMVALHYACFTCSISSIELLIHHGATINIMDDRGLTPLHMACHRNDQYTTDIVDILIKAGADVNIRDQWNGIPLHIACEKEYLFCVDLLLKAGSDYTIYKQKGHTPLEIAVAKQNQALIDLITSYIDLDIKPALD
jgi:ankyrin repeat/SOCS box protein 13